MKVQGINNQNNLSHKAYFKPNAEIKKLCDISAKTYEMVQAYKNFKNISSQFSVLQILEIYLTRANNKG